MTVPIMSFPGFDAEWLPDRDGVAFRGAYGGTPVRFVITREALGVVAGKDVDRIKGRQAVHLFEDHRDRILPIAHSVWSRVLDPGATVTINLAEVLWDPQTES
jgi:hypothetical protein